jgi:hypothetical protein
VLNFFSPSIHISLAAWLECLWARNYAFVARGTLLLRLLFLISALFPKIILRNSRTAIYAPVSGFGALVKCRKKSAVRWVGA